MQAKQKKYMALTAILVASIIFAFGFNFSDGWEWIYPYDPNATPTPSPTQPWSTIYPTQTPVGQTPTPTPIYQTPTPIPTVQPTVNPTPVKPTIKIWPTLYVTKTDLSTYWVQPDIQIGPESIAAEHDEIMSYIKEFQNNVYLQADFHGRSVSVITVYCHEVIKMTRSDGSLLGQLASADLTQSISNPAENSAIYVSGSTINSVALQALLYNIGASTSTLYNFVVELSNVNIVVTFSDGTQGLLHSTQTSTLKWEVAIV